MKYLKKSKTFKYSKNYFEFNGMLKGNYLDRKEINSSGLENAINHLKNKNWFNSELEKEIRIWYQGVS